MAERVMSNLSPEELEKLKADESVHFTHVDEEKARERIAKQKVF
jgi:hypothetical protein